MLHLSMLWYSAIRCAWPLPSVRAAQHTNTTHVTPCRPTEPASAPACRCMRSRSVQELPAEAVPACSPGCTGISPRGGPQLPLGPPGPELPHGQGTPRHHLPTAAAAEAPTLPRCPPYLRCSRRRRRPRLRLQAQQVAHGPTPP